MDELENLHDSFFGVKEEKKNEADLVIQKAENSIKYISEEILSRKKEKDLLIKSIKEIKQNIQDISKGTTMQIKRGEKYKKHMDSLKTKLNKLTLRQDEIRLEEGENTTEGETSFKRGVKIPKALSQRNKRIEMQKNNKVKLEENKPNDIGKNSISDTNDIDKNSINESCNISSWI